MRELQIIEDLMVKQKMKPGVVNVLIAYVLIVNDNKFNKNYVEAIASQWCREKIETVEDAMKYAEKQYKKMQKQKDTKDTKTTYTKKKEELPAWFNTNEKSKEITKEDEEEMKNILDTFS